MCFDIRFHASSQNISSNSTYEREDIGRPILHISSTIYLESIIPLFKLPMYNHFNQIWNKHCSAGKVDERKRSPINSTSLQFPSGPQRAGIHKHQSSNSSYKSTIAGDVYK